MMKKTISMAGEGVAMLVDAVRRIPDPNAILASH